MYSLLKIGSVTLVLFLCFFHKCAKDKHADKSTYSSSKLDSISIKPTHDQNTFLECSEITRQVLVTHCGSCHQSSLPTQKAGALAIFDLDKNELWHMDLKKHHTEGIGNRLLNKSSITDNDIEAIEKFLHLKEEELSHY